MSMREHKREITKSVRDFFERGMRGHTAVWELTSFNDDVYEIKRTGGRPTLKVLIVDIYIFGEADVVELREKYPDIDCIVLVGFYNRYSSSAKDMVKDMGFGLFTNSEFFGALNLTGGKFFNYEKK